MQILILIPAFLVFLYCLYKVIKDDYVFIRRNISLEQVFDVALVIVFVSLVFLKLSLFLAILGGMGFLYLIAKYKKIPLGRLFDFFTLAFVVALPVGYAFSAFLLRDYLLFLSLTNAFLYSVFALFSGKFIYPRLMSRELKEGSLHILFLIFFCFVSFLDLIIIYQKNKFPLVTLENILLIIFFFFSLFLFFKQARSGFTNRKRL